MEKLQKDLEKRSWFFGVITLLSIALLTVNWLGLPAALSGSLLTGNWLLLVLLTLFGETTSVILVSLGTSSFMFSLIFAQCAKQVEQKIMNHAHPRA